jgi:hypothetical protein
MALDKDRLGDAIADRVLSFAGIAPGAPDEAQLRQLWKAIAEEIIDEIKLHADIVLGTGDVQVLPGTFAENLPVPNTPITGQGVNNAVVLEQKIT